MTSLRHRCLESNFLSLRRNSYLSAEKIAVNICRWFARRTGHKPALDTSMRQQFHDHIERMRSNLPLHCRFLLLAPTHVSTAGSSRTMKQTMLEPVQVLQSIVDLPFSITCSHECTMYITEPIHTGAQYIICEVPEICQFLYCLRRMH